MSSTGKASRRKNRRRPSSACRASLAIVPFMRSPCSSGHQVGEDALQRLVAGGELEQGHVVLPGQSREVHREAAQVTDLHVEVLAAQADGTYGLVRHQHR